MYLITDFISFVSLSSDSCAAAPVVGPCKGTFPRWYYDQQAGECKHFLYGGCQGNHNNFLQESDCVSQCIQKSENRTYICVVSCFYFSQEVDASSYLLLLYNCVGLMANLPLKPIYTTKISRLTETDVITTRNGIEIITQELLKHFLLQVLLSNQRL